MTTKLSAYAIVSANCYHGYGNINIHIYDALGFIGGPTVKLTCQTGGLTSDVSSAEDIARMRQSYAWERGLFEAMGVINFPQLTAGVKLFKKIERNLIKIALNHERFGYIPNNTFANYAARTLQAAGVREVYVNYGINNTSYSKSDLPVFNAVTNPDALEDAIYTIESQLIDLTEKKIC